MSKNWYEVMLMYAKANILGIKPRLERYAGSPRWFDGNVLIEHNTPIARLEKTLGGDWLLLRTDKSYAWVEAVHKPEEEWEDWQKIKRLRNQTVPDLILKDICVSPAHLGGKLTGRKLHNAVHKQYVAEVESHFDTARRTLASRLYDNPYIRTSILDSLERTLKDYQTYRVSLAPWLPDLPDRKEELTELINAKIVRYGSVEQTTKRERAAARKEARQAFDLEEDRKHKKV